MKTIFGKVVVIIIVLLVPIIILYRYSFETSVQVVKENVETINWNRLSFFMSQLDSHTEELSQYSVIVSREPSIKEYMQKKSTGSQFEVFRAKVDIEKKLSLQIATSGWVNQLTLYFPDDREIISTDYSIQYENAHRLLTREPRVWVYENSGSKEQSYFSKYFRGENKESYLTEVRFAYDNIINMLNQLKHGGHGDPFFFHPNKDPFLNRSADARNVAELTAILNERSFGEEGSMTIQLNGKKYIVNYIPSKNLQGWYLVDYFPLQEVLFPITDSRNFFYGSIGLLLGMSMLAAFLLYRNVQIPIRLLIKGVRRLRNGDYSTRLPLKQRNEFQFLFASFNDMASEIRRLIVTILEDKILLREASLKQLQSQINPHFLYNCLYYIKNMANLGNKEAVVAMALNLGDYFRYTTRLENANTTIEDEIGMIGNYLAIQNLRSERMHYEIDIPPEMLAIRIPRLTLQPIVENAIIHGVEKKLVFGYIHIKGQTDEGVHRIVVEDNGPGMSDARMIELIEKVKRASLDEEIGCGLWNVNQRLHYKYGEGSGLSFSRSPAGGLRVEVRWTDRPETIE